MKIKTNCTKCGKTIEVHSDKWITTDRYTDKELIELKIDIINENRQLIKEKRKECYRCFFRMK